MQIKNITQQNVKSPLSNYKNNCLKQNKGDVFVSSCSPNLAFRGNGIYNFGEVIEGKLFRGSLPETEAHFAALKEKGVTFILDLCGLYRLDEAEIAKKYGMEYLYVDGTNLRFSSSDEDYKRITTIIDEKIKTGAVYVHCEEGQGRTGVLIAYYQKIKGKSNKEILNHANEYKTHILSIKVLLKQFEQGIFKA